MNILYLYSELMPYNIPVLKIFTEKYSAKVNVISWDNRKLTPYITPDINGVDFFLRSSFNFNRLYTHIKDFNPDIIYVSGWMDKLYLLTLIPFKFKGKLIVTGCDTLWTGSLIQVLKSLVIRVTKNLFFTHIWIPGPLQYKYSSNLGFKKNNTVFNCYSADVDLFNKAILNDKYQTNIKKRFIYVGRLEKIKGLDLLVQAWKNLQEFHKDWELVIIGSGDYETVLAKEQNIILHPFKSQDELIEEIKNAHCFILPSIYEPWALVIHEFASAGMPMICSDVCGANSLFLINNYNGFVFKNNSKFDLYNKMLNFINLPNKEKQLMSSNSIKLSNRITPEISAASFISILN
jgi:glycosyltransferase involved in cell wall biosynthesis